jgi:SOS-response transcriptional repressor LexA
MTEAQKVVYMVIDEWWKKYGFGPSVEDIMRLTGDRSKSTVHGKMKRLVRLGFCKQVPGRSRSIRPAYLRVRDIE